MTDEKRNLDSIPYDVFHQIASGLDFQDFINLSRVNKAIRASMCDNDMLARKTVENYLKYTKEGAAADKTKTGYRRAVGHLFDIKDAFATGRPYSASMIAYGNSAHGFLYQNGCLCYVHRDDIRVLDVHRSAKVEQVVNISYILPRIIPGCNPQEDWVQLSLLHYNDGILAFLILREVDDRREKWLVALDVRAGMKAGRLRFRENIQNANRLFVRHNKSHLYYGTYDMTILPDLQQAPRWRVSCVDLKQGRHTTNGPVTLRDFVGCDIGQTICFEMFDKYLYAVSNVVEEEEEVDWTSFYDCICLSPSTDTRSEVTLARIWRRQHREGPINDTWTDISLRKDEATGRLVILEGRREWLAGGSENYRTYYTQPLPSPQEIQNCRHHQSSAPTQLPDDPLTQTLEASDKPNYEPPRKRLRRNYHSEYEPGSDPLGRHHFILAKTRHRTYNPSSSTFIDLVNDPDMGFAAGVVRPDRLRLRMVSRKRKSPIDEDGEEGEPKMLYRPSLFDDDGKPLEHSEERFESLGVRLWPPEDAPKELYDLLCPTRWAGGICAFADERSMIYMVNPPLDKYNANENAIICISFDPRIQFSGLQRLSRDGTRPSRETEPATSLGTRLPTKTDITPERKFIPLNPDEYPHYLGQCRNVQSTPKTSVRQEPAMHLGINHAYWLR